MCVIESNSKDLDKDILKLATFEFIKRYPFKFRKISFIDLGIEEITHLNTIVLNHDYPTDVITFTYDIIEVKDVEIYFSSEYLKQDLKSNENFKHELLRLYLHGLLHSVGFNDDTPKNKNIMAFQENLLLEKINMFHVKP